MGADKTAYPAPPSWPGIWSYTYADTGVTVGGSGVTIWADQGPWASQLNVGSIPGNSWAWAVGGGIGGTTPGYAQLVTNVINGHPALMSNNTAPVAGLYNVCNTNATGGSLGASGSFLVRSMASAFTLSMVVQSTASPNTDYGVLFEIENGNGPILDVSSAGTAYDVATSFGGRGTLTGGVLTTSVPHILNLTYNAPTPGSGNGTLTLYVDGTSVATGTTPASDLPASNSIPLLYSYNSGGTYGFQGYIATVAIQCAYCAAGAQLIAQNRYLGAKYGITVP